MSAHRTLAALAGAIALSGCSAVQTTTTSASDAAPARPGRAANGLVYSTAPANTVQPMPAPGACHYRGSGLVALSDARCTPGALNPAVTQQNIRRTICRPGGYTASVRPPESVTDPEKRASIAAYSNSAPLSAVEFDHEVSLSLGGAVNDPANLWPEKRGLFAGAEAKDRLEDFLHRAVCSRRLALSAAQRAIASDWVAAYQRFMR